jgi:hypothetical protein
MYHPKLLKWLLAPFFMMVAEEGGGGGDTDADAIARGDMLPGDDPEEAANAEAQAKADAEAQAVKKAAEDEAAKAAAEEEKEEKEEKDEKEDGKEEKEKKKDSRIPLSRHKELLEKERAQRESLEAELAKFKGGERIAQTNEQIQAAETKVEELEAKYTKLVADGELDKATAAMREIRKLEREIGDHKADMKANEAEARAIERVRFDAIVDRIESSYPEMDPKSDDYDEPRVAEVLEMKDAFQLKGYAPSAALQKAVKYVLGAETGKQKTATTADPRLDKEEVEKARAEEEKKAAKAAGRKEDQIRKNIDTALKQPPSTAKIGMDSDKAGGGVVDAAAIMKMSQTDFAKLDEKQLAVMRGDELVA